MASLQEIKLRLSSVSTTKKITKAMQMVATAKLRKAKSHLEGIQEYYTSVYDTFQGLLNEVKDISEIIKINPNGPMLYIALTSDLGLSGAYNANILKLLLEKSKVTDKIIMVGTKGVGMMKAKNKVMFKEFPQAGDEPNYLMASQIGKEVIDLIISGSISGVKIVHTKFINSVTFEPKITQILPVDKSEIEKLSKIHGVQNTKPEFEPSASAVVQNSLPLYINALIFGIMVESKVSEMSSRRTAMENATDNANDLIDKLELEYNRVRQASITQEISEIVAGSEE